MHRENEERAKQAEKLAEQFSAQETRIAELEQSSAEARERLAAQEDRLAQHREAEGAAAAALERAEQAAPRRRTNSIRLRSSAPPRRPALPGWTDSRMICIARSKTQVTA